VANSLALKKAGITRETPNPAHGIVVKDPSSGEPTGMLRGSSATALLQAPGVGGAATPAERRLAVKKLLALYNSEPGRGHGGL
jgi:predicted amidohydrolase YtcJ